MDNRFHAVAKWASLACFAASLAVLVVALPLDALLEALQGWIQGLGLLAPLAFSVLYGVLTTLLVPGSAVSLAAGVLFGVWLGTAVVWAGATAAVVLSFLIARYAARARVEALAATRPRFAAVDRAIGEQGWKIVALMRLSPLFPFGLQNYLFGVTAIRFWPCCIASAVCIVPGTFLYVYLGYAGGEAAAAVGGSGSADMLRLGLQFSGLLATLAVTVYVARTAARAIAKHAPVKAPAPSRKAAAHPPRRALFRTTCTLVAAFACLAASLLVYARRESIRSLLLPQSLRITKRAASGAGTGPPAPGAFEAVPASPGKAIESRAVPRPENEG